MITININYMIHYNFTGFIPYSSFTWRWCGFASVIFRNNCWSRTRKETFMGALCTSTTNAQNIPGIGIYNAEIWTKILRMEIHHIDECTWISTHMEPNEIIASEFFTETKNILYVTSFNCSSRFFQESRWKCSAPAEIERRKSILNSYSNGPIENVEMFFFSFLDCLLALWKWWWSRFTGHHEIN